jgi:hypothetical protein
MHRSITLPLVHALTALSLIASSVGAVLLSRAVMAVQSAAPTSVTLAGDLQSALGCPDNWQPECAATHLTDRSNGVWRGQFNVSTDSWQYKVAPNNA